MRTSGLVELVGKRVTAIVITDAEPDAYYGEQLFLVFDDDTWFELYGSPKATSGCVRGDLPNAIAYAQKMQARRIHVIGADRQIVSLAAAEGEAAR